MTLGANGSGRTVEYRGFDLENHSHDDTQRVWGVCGNESYVDRCQR